MHWKTITAGIAGLLITGYSAGNALAAVTYTGPFTGQDVTYSNIVEASADPMNDPEPLYGDPNDPTNPEILPPNLLDFDPSAGAFAADAPPPETTDGSLVFLVTSNDGSNLNQVTFNEGGDYGFSGINPSGEFVTDVLNVTFRDPATEQALFSNATGSFSEVFDNPVNLNEQGNWNVNVTDSLANLNIDSVIVELNNRLTASSTSGNTAFIRKKNFQVNFTTIPEPASLVLLGLGGVLIGCGRARKS